MRVLGAWCGGLVAWYLLSLSAVAMTSLDELDRELAQVKQEHQEANYQALNSFFNEIDAAMESPDAAMNLYQRAGGILPTPTVVTTQYVDETPSEKEARLAQDQENASRIGYLVQMHCGLMHYAALFVVKPDTKGLQEEWITWLKEAAQNYPQLRGTENLRGIVPANSTDSADSDDNNAGNGSRNKKGKANPEPKANPETMPIGDWKGMTMVGSIISQYLGFQGWGGKEQAQWSVKSLPELYRANVLEPLRASPSAGTLRAWDVYIAMKQADARDAAEQSARSDIKQPDAGNVNKWDQDEYPYLQFERGCDDFAIRPSTEKLAALVDIIKANPTHSKADEWIARVHEMMKAYRDQKSGGTPSTPTVASPGTISGGPSVIVTTTTEGDMTVVTTHTNAPPAKPMPSPAR